MSGGIGFGEHAAAAAVVAGGRGAWVAVFVLQDVVEVGACEVIAWVGADVASAVAAAVLADFAFSAGVAVVAWRACGEGFLFALACVGVADAAVAGVVQVAAVGSIARACAVDAGG